MKLGLTESCHLDPECQRTYVRCVDPKCCWEVLWASVIFFTNNALYSSVTSDDTHKRASVASSGLRYHEHLALAQHFSVLCHRMLSAYQDECHWLQHPQQIGWWTMIECRPGQQIGWIVAVLGVQELSGGSQPRFLHEAAQSSMNNGFWHPVCFVDGTGLLNNWSSPNVHANQQPC